MRTIIVDSSYSGSTGLPIWSAASVATFSPLASEAGYSLSFVPRRRCAESDQLGGKHPVEVRSSDPSNNVYSFTYATTLPHLIVNEYQNANEFPEKNGHKFRLTHPGPYHFQEKGKLAFQGSQ